MKGEQFVKLPCELLASPAWQEQSINCRRFINFLMLENMRHGGCENGSLIAPYRQLCAFGIKNGERVSEAINEAERLGLVIVQRGDRRRPNRYALAWFPLHNGSLPIMAWHQTRPDLRDKAPSKVRDNPPSKRPISLRDKASSLYRNSYQGGGISKEVENGKSSAEGHPAGEGSSSPTNKAAQLDHFQCCDWYVTGPAGFRLCGRPIFAGAEYCPEHLRARLAQNHASGKPKAPAPVP